MKRVEIGAGRERVGVQSRLCGERGVRRVGWVSSGNEIEVSWDRGEGITDGEEFYVPPLLKINLSD